jgi:hypothetical protein
MSACRVLGHRYRLRAESETTVPERMRGSKAYGSAADAKRYARAFDREDRADLGRRAPFLGMFPLRLWRLWRDRG